MQNQLPASVLSQEHIYPALMCSCYMHQSGGSTEIAPFLCKTRITQKGANKVKQLIFKPSASFSVIHFSFPILIGKVVYPTSSSLSGICHQFSVRVQHTQECCTPSESICAFLFITDGHIFISHHTDLESNFGASSPKLPHFCTWTCCP